VGRAAVWAVAAIGIGLLGWQYAAGASLWIDELALVRNVIDRGWRELVTTPLADAQVAPIGFLALEKLATIGFGQSEHALRLVPFLCAVGGIVLLTRAALNTLRPYGALVAVSVVALSTRLLWNGSLVKQYAGDVFVCATVLWLVPWLLSGPSRRRSVVAAMLGIAAAFLSQPGVFVLAGGGAALVMRMRSASAPERRRGLVVAGLWVFAGGLSGLLSRALVAPETMTYMRDFWSHGFAPVPPRSVDDMLWPWHSIAGLFTTALGGRGGGIFAAGAVAGAMLLARRHVTGVIIIAAIVLAMMASAARLFPFLDRAAVFAVPLLALACGAAVDAVSRRIAQRSSLMAWVIPLLCVAVPAQRLARRPPVYRVQESLPVLEWIARRRQDGDALYVYYGAWQAMRHYGPRAGLTSLPTVWGRCHGGAPREYLRELDALRGTARVWIFVTHAEPRFAERDAILGYLDAIGVRRESLSIPEPYQRSVASAEAHLYDLSDPVRLMATDAERARLPAGTQLRAQAGACAGPVIPDERWLRGGRPWS
jgi:hypothetical protein